ncbi:SLC13 family permease [Natranaerobius thermophilus]|uniref:SLC13 family permease n=1 Tax=Natranaerobius thermophilus TaxID=375929 RepID=UPI00130DC2B4|nr:SLC13 family permease [Natranaerobius thermophilus]
MITFLILIIAIILFFLEILPLPVTAMLVPISLSLTGILEPQDAFSYFGDRWVIVFLGMFIISGAMFKTGFANRIGDLTVKIAGNNGFMLLFLVMLVLGVMSAFLSNTGATAVFVPVVVAVCLRSGINSKKMLMPMAFASSLGGTLTVIGTPPNGIVNSVLNESAKYSELGFFEFSKVGIFIFIIGILYMVFFGYKLLPKESTDEKEAFEDFSQNLRTEKMWFALLIFIFVIISMATGIIDLQVAAMLGAMLTIITGCLTMNEAFNSVNWTTIFLFAGMLSMSQAIEDSGAADLIANQIVNVSVSPYIVLGILFITTALLTNFMSNTATAAIFAPIAINIAESMSVSPYPFMMAIAISASCCFLTPIATPPNTIVLGPAGYRFKDYFIAGWPLQVITFIVAMIIIPIFFPF